MYTLSIYFLLNNLLSIKRLANESHGEIQFYHSEFSI